MSLRRKIGCIAVPGSMRDWRIALSWSWLNSCRNQEDTSDAALNTCASFLNAMLKGPSDAKSRPYRTTFKVATPQNLYLFITFVEYQFSSKI
jgi:hypothetical protein